MRPWQPLLACSALLLLGIGPAGNVDWPMYNQTYDGERNSTLRLITTRNVGGLHVLCKRLSMGWVSSRTGCR